MGFIGSDGRLFHPSPRSAVVPGLARSRAPAFSGPTYPSSRVFPVDVESQPLITSDALNDGKQQEERERTSGRHSRRQRQRISDRLAPDSPWDEGDLSDEEGNFHDAKEGSDDNVDGDGEEDEESFVFVRPDFISVPQESPKL